MSQTVYQMQQKSLFQASKQPPAYQARIEMRVSL